MDRFTHDPFGQAQIPATFTREGRIKLLADAADALLAGHQPSPESAMFVGAGLKAWLDGGGDLPRDYWKVAAKAGSHRTPASVWRELQTSSGGAQESDVTNKVEEISTESEQ